ncbi:ABC transporter permease [uncultured Maritimibacter sp.]|uniref:ABC transporter permease n=1 Tax=uncultured Maritimibacter sp. TaxID=991866 RepID=UPI000A681C7E|nr:ABC transporter permease [uncultured Maritimibacter sp.]
MFDNRKFISQVLVGAGLLALWQLAAMSGTMGRDLLPLPLDVFSRLIELPFEARFWSALQLTLASAFLGLCIAAVIGIPLGLIIGANPRVYRATRFLVDLFRSWPIIALMPVLVLLFGASFKMKLIMVVLAALWPILVQSIYGARRVEPTIEDMTLSYGIGGRVKFFEVALPNALPFIMTGLRISTALSVLLSIGVEVLSSVPGIGYEIAIARIDGASAEVIAYVIVSGFLGLTLNQAFAAIERYVLAWHPSVRGETA